ncbi:MAG: choline ABC transporter ATP-binding protein [Gammaproteobacteria bacterium]
MSHPAIRLDSVSIVFGDAPARALPLMDAGQSREQVQDGSGQVLGVHDCSLEVRGGEIVVLMGLSGSGKSTLLRAVNRLNPVVRGRVWVDDGAQAVDLTAADAATVRKFRTGRIAMVFQQFGLLPWRTVADNIAFGLEIAGVPPLERARRVERQLAMVNLHGCGARKIQELSGGMQQRVGLARAFATESPILLMDEPFSALDPLIRTRLQDELLELQKNLHRTILFVSHDLDEALKIGNRIVIMEGGRIVQIGAPQEIVSSPANAYVADFVAHMNPLKTLRAAQVMRTMRGAPADGCVAVNMDTPLRQVLRAKRDSGKPLYVMENNECAGIIEDADIYTALLGSGRADDDGGDAPS